ncbi:MAG: thermonuclease family protein [Alphaproteobacteria bacterium]
MKYIFSILFIVFGFNSAFADLKKGDVISGSVWVIDGDSLIITAKDHKKYEVRIFGINAPELSTDKGQVAKRFMIRLIKSGNRQASCEFMEYDKYKRHVAICNNSKGDLAEIMLKNKQAWLFKRYLHKADKKIQNKYKQAVK